MDEDNLLTVDLFLEQINSVHNAGILDSGSRAIIDKLCALKGGHCVIVHLGSNGLRKLGVGLANGIAIAGKNSFVRQLNGLHGLLDGDGGGGSGQLHGLGGNAFSNVGGITDIGVLRHGHGVTGNALKRGVDLRKRRNNDFVSNLRRDHVSHNLRIDKVSNFSNLISHSSMFLSNQFFVSSA